MHESTYSAVFYMSGQRNFFSMPWTKDNGVKVQKVSFILRVKLRIFACVLGNNPILIYLKYLHLIHNTGFFLVTEPVLYSLLLPSY